MGNRRVRTGRIAARAIDRRHVYTTHTLLRTYRADDGQPVVEYGSLDTYPDTTAKVVF